MDERTGIVLVVDDEEKNRRIIKDLLEATGHRVLEAEDGEQALRIVAQSPPDVVLLDIMMPGIDGFEVCRRLKKNPQTAPIPVLIVTALSERSDRLRGMEEGANDFILKPIDTRDVILRVRNAVYSKHLHDRVQENYEQLRELESLRDNLTHMIVHYMRQPITVIIGYLQVLLMKSEQITGKLKVIVDRAAAAANTLNEMVSSLLDVSRLEEGKMPLNLESCDLKALVEQAVEMIGPAGDVGDHRRIMIESRPNRVEALCDRGLIRRVITNLVGNAVKFLSKEGRVKITIEEAGGSKSRIAVSDTGPGIPEKYHAKIFEKFAQVETSRRGSKYSTGLGLTFCKLAVQAHGGEIGVQSEPGKGSTFWFII